MNRGAATGGVIAEAAQVTPEWLTAVLRREGVLDRGAVTAVDATRLPHLALSYSPDAPANVPTTLFLKIGRQGHPFADLGPLEVAAYRALVPHRSHLPMLLRCYDSACDLGTNASHLLLPDFSATHSLPTLPVPPEERDVITDCTARFHAYWWEHPQRDLFGVRDPNILLDCASAAAYKAYVAQMQEAYPYFANYLGWKLSVAERALFEQLLAALPSLWSRYLAPRFAAWDAITLVQGDSHWNQFACPRQGGDRHTLLVDLECLHWGLPAADLAYGLTLDWTPDERRAMEPELVARYLAGLRQHGVSGYDHERFWQDYQLSTAFVLLLFLSMFTACVVARIDHQRMATMLGNGWGGSLEYVLENYRDMRCEELLS